MDRNENELVRVGVKEDGNQRFYIYYYYYIIYTLYYNIITYTLYNIYSPYYVENKTLPVHKLLSYFPTLSAFCLAKPGLFRNFAANNKKT